LILLAAWAGSAHAAEGDPDLPADAWAQDDVVVPEDDEEEAPPEEEEAPAEEEEAPPEEEAPIGDPLSEHRVTLDLLADRTIGTTSRPVEFNWRRNTAQLALTGSYLFELNNFNAMRGGGMLRVPTRGIMLEVGLSYAATWDSPSSRLIALTPYRQPGRPPRLELDFMVALPLAEGVVTTQLRVFPAVQMVFNAYGGVRYALYPAGFAGLTAGQVTSRIFVPALSEEEIDNLEASRLDAMQVDPARYSILVGIGNDLYFKGGIFIAPRFLLSVPLLSTANDSQLLLWADASVAIGVAW